MQNFYSNPLMLTDAYNLSHGRLKKNVDFEVSHIYNRNQGMILYGFAEIVHDLLSVKIDNSMIKVASDAADSMGLQFPKDLFEKVVSECYGYAPLQIETLPEGTWCPKGTPFAQVKNTVKGYGELVTWWEGVFMHGWFPSSLATRALEMRKYLDSLESVYGSTIQSKFHSFGFRGHASMENAYWAAKTWAMFLKGTDDFHVKAYVPKAEVRSISASAHKVVQQFDNEIDAYEHALRATFAAGEKIVAFPIDTYNTYHVIENYVVKLAKMAEVLGIHVVFRPDSGDVWTQAGQIWEKAKENNLSNVSVIIGEGMTFEKARQYDLAFQQAGVPLTFVAYGIGSGYYQDLNRDTLGWAMKTAFSNGKPRMKFSQSPLKRSIPSEVALVRDEKHQLIVTTKEFVAENEKHYTDEFVYAYSYDPEETFGHNPFFRIPHWGAVRERALRQDTNQKEINIGRAVSEIIADLEAQYGIGQDTVKASNG